MNMFLKLAVQLVIWCVNYVVTQSDTSSSFSFQVSANEVWFWKRSTDPPAEHQHHFSAEKIVNPFFVFIIPSLILPHQLSIDTAKSIARPVPYSPNRIITFTSRCERIRELIKHQLCWARPIPADISHRETTRKGGMKSQTERLKETLHLNSSDFEMFSSHWPCGKCRSDVSHRPLRSDSQVTLRWEEISLAECR